MNNKTTISILFVTEKNKNVIRDVSRVFTQTQFDFHYVKSLDELEHIKFWIDLILIYFPDQFDLWIDHFIKHHPEYPIILLTDEIVPHRQATVLKRGVQEYLTYENFFNDNRAENIIRSAIYRAQLLDDLRVVNNEYTNTLSALLKSSERASASLSHKENMLLEKNLKHTQDIDYLTQIPNRPAFDELLKKSIHKATRYHQKFSLLFINIDNFKMINDTLGHHIGDLVLQAVAKLIHDNLSPEDTIARVGGDEFALILNTISTPKEAEYLAEKLLQSFTPPLRLIDQKIYTSVSIGIVCYPDSADDATSLLKKVDSALDNAKNSGRNNYKYHQITIDKIQKRNLQIEYDLHTAISNKELSLVYQPIVDLRTGDTSHFESLIRWKNPNLGRISPSEFIPIAERCGRISPITEWVINEVCRAISDQENIICPIAMNLSAIDIDGKGSAAFLKIFKALTKKYKIPSKLIQFEVTETAILKLKNENFSGLKSLKKMGVKIAIDDFGTGYSSFGKLLYLPIYAVKIDASFIKALDTFPRGKNIVSAIISLANRLSFKTIAEGVETKKQLDFLINHGCDYAQGHYFSKPKPLSSFEYPLKYDL